MYLTAHTKLRLKCSGSIAPKPVERGHNISLGMHKVEIWPEMRSPIAGACVWKTTLHVTSSSIQWSRPKRMNLNLNLSSYYQQPLLCLVLYCLFRSWLFSSIIIDSFGSSCSSWSFTPVVWLQFGCSVFLNKVWRFTIWFCIHYHYYHHHHYHHHPFFLLQEAISIPTSSSCCSITLPYTNFPPLISLHKAW